MLSFSAISRVVLHRLFSIIAFILLSSISVGRSKKNEQTNSGTGVLLMTFHHKHHTTFSELGLRFYLFGSDKIKCDENDRLESPFQINAKQ